MKAKKIIYLARRNPALAAAEFPGRWKQHAVLAGSISTVKDQVLGMAQCSRVLDGTALPDASEAYDGVSLLTVTNLDSIAASMRLPQHIAVLLPDELRVFSDYVSKTSLTAEETLLHAKPIAKARGCICVIGFLCSPGGDSWLAWARQVLAVEARKSLLLRLAWNDTITPPPNGPAFDGVSEMWFASLEDCIAFTASLRAECLDRKARDIVGHSVTMLTQVSHAWYVPGMLAVDQPG